MMLYQGYCLHLSIAVYNFIVQKRGDAELQWPKSVKKQKHGIIWNKSLTHKN